MNENIKDIYIGNKRIKQIFRGGDLIYDDTKDLILYENGIDYGLYLNGCYSIDDGYNIYDRKNYPIKESQYIQCTTVRQTYYQHDTGYNIRSLNKIDISKYKQIQVKVSSHINNSSDRYWGCLLYDNPDGTIISDGTERSNCIALAWQPTTYNVIETVLLNISNITSKKYIILGTAGGGRSIFFHEIKLLRN